MKKSKYESYISNFKSWFMCEATGELIPVEQYLDLYCKNDLAQIAGYELNEKQIESTVSFTMSLYPELSEKTIRKTFNKLPAVLLVFYLFRNFGFLNLDLFDLVFNFHISQESNIRLEFSLRYIHMYLYYSINFFIKEKYTIETEINEENNLVVFNIKNKNNVFNFQNLGSMRKVKDLIFEKELGIW